MIRLSKCYLSKVESNIISSVLDSSYLGMGSFVSKFETDLSKFLNTNVSTVINGTTALSLALQSIDIKKGDEVLVQSLTYLSSFQAITSVGAKPVACDVNPDMTICLNDAQSKITKKTKAIMPVHYAGDPGNLDEIYKFGKKNKLRIVEDAAHAFGSKYKDNLIGSIGDIVCFSFDGIKNITCGEGGCIVSKDKSIINRVNSIKLLGIENDYRNRLNNERTWVYDVFEQGWRAHLSNINAAIGIEQLKKINKIKNKRQQLAKYYDKKLKNFYILKYFNRDYDSVLPHIYPVLLSNSINREHLREYLKKNKIESGIHYYPNHLLTFFNSKKIKLNYTDKIYNNLLSLPLHPGLTISQIDYICKILYEYERKYI